MAGQAMNPDAHKLTRDVRSAMASILQSMAAGEPPRPEDIASARENLEALIQAAGGAPLPSAPADAVEAFAEYFESTGAAIGLNRNVVQAVPKIARAWATTVWPPPRLH